MENLHYNRIQAHTTIPTPQYTTSQWTLESNIGVWNYECFANIYTPLSNVVEAEHLVGHNKEME